MGGKGSGRWRREGAKRLVETTLTIDANRWRREGVFAPNERRDGAYSWWRGDACIGSVGYATACGDADGAALLAYRWNGASRRQRITLVTTPSNLGAGRWWAFRCPACDRRTRRLHLGNAGFACRRCAGLAYRSQREWHIPERLAKRLAKRLGATEAELVEALRGLDAPTLRLMNIVL